MACMVWLVRAMQEDKSSTLRLGPNAGIMESTEASWEGERRLQIAACASKLGRGHQQGADKFLCLRDQREKQHGSCAGCESLECTGWAVKGGRPRGVADRKRLWVGQGRMDR